MDSKSKSVSKSESVNVITTHVIYILAMFCSGIFIFRNVRNVFITVQCNTLYFSDKKLAVPPISTLLTPVSANNAPSTMHINANPPPISQPENLSQEVHATVLPPLETVIREDHHHKRAYIQQLPEQTELPPHLSNHLPHPLSQQARIGMIMPDIIQTHACHKCRRIECSCEADMEVSQL